MTSRSHDRHLLDIADLSREKLLGLIELARELKVARREGREKARLAGRHICLVFEKTSTRTRVAFEVAAHEQGAHVTYLDGSTSQMGHKESARDTARVLGRLYGGIAYRGFRQATVEELAAHAGVPVWNALTDVSHPTQVLADVMTMAEHSPRPLAETAYAFLGDAAGNMGRSLLMGGAILGMDVRLVAPRDRWPDAELVERARAAAAGSGARLTLTEDVEAGVKGVDFVHTDVWLSLGEPEAAWEERIRLLEPYRVDARVMAATGHPQARFMHCLPAFHDRETSVGARIFERFGVAEMEVSDEVFESPASIVFDQSENRMHTIKALMVATLTEG